MFCISGTLSDIFCMPDLRILSFEELLNERLKKIGYKSVVFYSGAKGVFFALDDAGRNGLSVLRKKRSQSNETEGVQQSAPPQQQERQRAGVGRRVRKTPENRASSDDFITKVNEQDAPDLANRYMCNTDEKRAFVITSLDDFINNSEQGRRMFSAYFEDWKSLPNENGNICIFLSKSINLQNMQQIFEGQNAMSLQSMFIRGMTSGGAEFNHNSSLIVGSPLNDEIGYLLEYLRIKGYTYTRRNENNDEERVTAKLLYKRSDFDKIVRSLSFYNRESEFSELKTMKEALETFMRSDGRERVPIFPDDIPEIYPQSNSRFNDSQNPMELLKSRQGWEPAYNVLNSFILNHRKMYGDRTKKTVTAGRTDIERIEPDRSENLTMGAVPNFVLQGPPGVGKTEIANLIGQILQREGVLKSGHTVIGSRDKLVGQYVGSTAIQTATMIEQAQEGVLLVDEVYSLAEGGNTSSGANYCAEVFNTLVASMTDKNYRFCVIFAGYESRMDEVWHMNEGLFSRFGESNVINIEGYKPELLQTIFEKNFEDSGDSAQKFVLSDEVKEGLPQFFKNYYEDRDRVNFANARDIKNLSATVKRTAGYRCIQDNISGEVTVKKGDFGAKAELFKKRGLDAGDIYGKIKEYVGMDFLIDLFNDQLSLKIEYEEKGLDYPGPSHMIWCGNPGTGKSTAAQLTADLYHSLGILGGTKPIYLDASQILKSHIGGGAEEIQKRMDEACQHHTILVIEEAYQLQQSGNGREVIDAMLNRMESDRKNFNVIFIVYKDRLRQFLDVNPGMESRVQIYEFKDYNGEQLLEIFRLMCKKSRDTIDSECEEKIREMLSDMYEKGLTKQGNARIVRKLLENMRQLRYNRILSEYASRLDGGDTPENRGKIATERAMGRLKVSDDAYCFKAEDVPSDFAEKMVKQSVGKM